MKPMVSKQDLRAAQAIADWNTAHGSVLERVTAACGALEEACELALSNRLRTPRTRLPAQQDTTLRAWPMRPYAVRGPEYHNTMIRADADSSATAKPESSPARLTRQTSRKNGEAAAALLVKGRQITSQATAFASDLLRRVQHH